MPARGRGYGPYGPLLRELLEGEPLNDREREVLVWAARGKTAASTGPEIFLATETVKSYRKRACAKLGADSLTHGVAIALARGLIAPSEVLDD